MSSDVESRLAHLEQELTRIKSRLQAGERPWWEQIRGTFRNDRLHAAAMKIARAERRRSHPNDRS